LTLNTVRIKSNAIIKTAGLFFILFFSLTVLKIVCAQPAIPYQIPQTIYVGDNGKLVYPLDGFFLNKEDALIPLDNIPQNDEIVLHRIELSKGNLIIDFQAFRTGIISLPPIRIDGEVLTDMNIKISSLIDVMGAPELSPAETPMNAPGILLIIALAVLIILAFIALILFLSLYGVTFLLRINRFMQKRHATQLTKKTIKKIKKRLSRKLIGFDEAVAAAARELRLFLNRYCTIDCNSFVPSEFLTMKLDENLMPDKKYSPKYFCDFFTRCDVIRFSGRSIPAETAHGIINEVEEFVCDIKNMKIK
jgi:hypothetical protein